MRRLIAVLGLVLVVSACGSTPGAEIPVQRVSMTLTDSSSGFGLKLLSELLLGEKDSGNVFISPLSATLMLSMAASAADPTERAQMLTVLGIDPSINADEQARQTIARLLSVDPSAQLELAQAVWAQNGLALNPDYVQRLKTDYAAHLSNIDFQSPAAPGIVNRWVAAKTHDKITTLFDSFDPSTVGLIVNATYFHALWATEFKPMPEGAPFHNFSGSDTTPPFMSRGGVTEYATNQYTAMLLPYKGGRFSAVVILPSAVLSPAEFAAFLTPQVWSNSIDGFRAGTGETFGQKCDGRTVQGDKATIRCDVELQMPKFKLEYRKDLTETLTAMGMPAAPSLPGFCSACQLTTVLQKTYLEVDEKGTTAAAVTGGIVDSALPVPVVVDRPFAFALIDNATGAPMFLGAIGNLS